MELSYSLTLPFDVSQAITDQTLSTIVEGFNRYDEFIEGSEDD